MGIGPVMKIYVSRLQFDVFTDADFAELFVFENKSDPISVKRRTNVLLNLGGVPILWLFKLKTGIVLSTQETEYITLSQGMCGLVAARGLLKK